MTRTDPLKWTLFFCLNAVESVLAMFWLTSIPGEEAAAIFFGLSFYRLLLATIPVVLFVLSIFGALIFNLRARLSVKFLAWLGDLKNRSVIGAICILLSIGMAVFVQISTISFGLSDAVVMRLLPIECLLMLVFPQTGLVIQQNPLVSEKLKISTFWRPFCLSLGFIAMLLILGLWGGIQPVKDTPFFSGKGAPILPTQLFFVLYIILITLFVYVEFPAKNRWFKRLDLFVCFALFLLTAFVWSHTPIPVNYFTHFSNFIRGELIPFSDSRIYDVNAQQMVLGYGLAGGNPLPRPLYSFFLGLLHAFFGQSFSTIIQAQTVVLALIPAGIYLLGKRLYQTTLGLSTALFFIFRETNQALLSSIYTLSSVRMMMSEVFVAGFLVALLIAAGIWLDKPESRTRSFITGILLGLTALIRTQVLLLVFVLLLFLFFALIKHRRKFVISSMIFLIGLLLVVIPWMGRNAIQSGKFVFEDPNYASHTILTIPDGNDSLNYPNDIFSTSVKYIQRTASLLTNSMLSSLYQLPWDWNLHENLADSVSGQIDQPFVNHLEANTSPSSSIIVHLFFLAAGLAGAWRRKGLSGLLPAGIYLGYGLSSAAVGFSGWRFIQPVDWILPFYWIIGVIEFICFVFFLNPWQSKESSLNSQKKPNSLGKKLVLIGACAACFLLPFGELFFPQSTIVLDRSMLLSKMNQFNNSQQAQAVIKLAMNLDTEINNGTVLYPQFLEKKGDFWLNKLDGLTSLNQSVLVFDVVTHQSKSYYLPLSDPPDFVIHNTPALIVSCKNGVNNQAIAMLFLEQEPFWLFSSQPIPNDCGYAISEGSNK